MELPQSVSLPLLSPAPLPGLRGSVGLDEVDALMLTLGVGRRFARAGLMVQEVIAAGGKRVRARLALGAAEAFGIERADAVPWAAACELLHNATLVHDDLQDGDTTRRGEPTAWVRHGAAQAINAGDLLLMLPFRAVEHLAVPDAVGWRLARALARAAEATVRGQSFEMDLLGARRLGWEDWESAAAGKTGALIGLPVEGAAHLAGLDVRTAAGLGEVFARIGVLFQLHDDLLDVSGAKGRPPGSDLYAGKVSALVVEHLALHPDDAPWLLGLLATPRDATDAAEVARAITLLHDGGAVRAARDRARTLARDVEASELLSAVPELHALAIDLLSSLVRA